MTMAPLGGIVSSSAGAPLSQTAGTDTERLQRDSSAQGRQVDSNQQAERAAGIGQTNEDQESSERDADGRRLWELPGKPAKKAIVEEAAEAAVRQSKDASGQSGMNLDLTG